MNSGNMQEKISQEMPKDSDTLYYVYELEMPEEMKQQLQKKAESLNMTLQDLLTTTLKNFVAFAESCEKQGRSVREMLPDIEASPGETIDLVRCYPVHRGETEDRAREKAMKEEKGQQNKNFPPA